MLRPSLGARDWPLVTLAAALAGRDALSEACAAVDGALLDERALGRGKGRLVAIGGEVRGRNDQPRVAAHAFVGSEQRGELVLGRDGEGVTLAVALPAAVGGRLGRERPPGRRRLRLGNGERPRQRLVEAGAGQVTRRREAPGGAAANPNPHALALVALELVDAAVARADRLGARVDVARVGVVAAQRRRLHEH